MKIKYYLQIIFITLSFLSCGKGISPEPEEELKQTGFGGTITFIGNWPEGVKRTYIVAFRNPLNSVADFNALNLGFVSDSIPYGISTLTYSSLINPGLEIQSGEYSYVAVAQSKSEQLSFNRVDWYVIGLYYNEDKTAPGKLVIPENIFVRDINIICDFDNPPPQPPGE